jgi:hypothetical protein
MRGRAGATRICGLAVGISSDLGGAPTRTTLEFNASGTSGNRRAVRCGAQGYKFCRMGGLGLPSGWSWHLAFAGCGEPPPAWTGASAACCCRRLPEPIQLCHDNGYFGCVQPRILQPKVPTWARISRELSQSQRSEFSRQCSEQSLPSGSTYDSFHRWVPGPPSSASTG